MEPTKIYSIEIELSQGLTLDDYKELADNIESAVHQCNYPVEYNTVDDITFEEDVIVAVNLVEKTVFDPLEDEEEE